MEQLNLMEYAPEMMWGVIVLLMGVLIYLLKLGLNAQIKLNTTNIGEHAKIIARLDVGAEKFKQVKVNKDDIKDLDDRVDEHDIKINEHGSDIERINGDVKILYKKI